MVELLQVPLKTAVQKHTAAQANMDHAVFNGNVKFPCSRKGLAQYRKSMSEMIDHKKISEKLAHQTVNIWEDQCHKLLDHQADDKDVDKKHQELYDLADELLDESPQSQAAIASMYKLFGKKAPKPIKVKKIPLTHKTEVKKFDAMLGEEEKEEAHDPLNKVVAKEEAEQETTFDRSMEGLQHKPKSDGYDHSTGVVAPAWTMAIPDPADP